MRTGFGRQRRIRGARALRTGRPSPRAPQAGPSGCGPLPSASRDIRPKRVACPPPASPGPWPGRRRGNRWETPPRRQGRGPIPGSRGGARHQTDGRRAATKATSGALTVSGPRRSRKPVSAAKTMPPRLARVNSVSKYAIVFAMCPCRPPAGAITTRSPLTSSVRLPWAARREERAGRSSADTRVL